MAIPLSTNHWLLIIGLLVTVTCTTVVASYQAQSKRDDLQDARNDKMLTELLTVSKRLDTAFHDMASRSGDIKELHKLSETLPALTHRLAVLEQNMLALEKTIGKLEHELATGKRGS